MWPFIHHFQTRRQRRRFAARHREPFSSGRMVELLERRELLTVAVPELTALADAANVDYLDYLVVFSDQSPAGSPTTSSSPDAMNAANREFAHELEHHFGESVEVRYEFNNAIKGLALSLTATQADYIQGLPNVSEVLADSSFTLQQNSAELTGAPGVWDGTALAGVDGTFGEGVLVGIVDSGIDFDNPSFAATGPIDGYVHTNPFGEGTYLGVCDPNHPDHDPDFACNDKIVGAYDFTDDTQINDANFADHGTSVAGIAAGNFVNVTVPGTNNTDEISGVAPHANIISYDVCDSSDNCSSIAIVAAVDQAIADGVDVLNMSIGGPTESPWTGLMAQAMWNAYNAGIFVAVSAGNQGPEGASITAPADAPWVTAVAATDSSILTTVHVDVVGDDVPDSLLQISAIRGENLSIDTDVGPASIVHVADLDPGDHLGSSAFPADSLAGRVALIDRGESLFETKVQNAFDAGAIGVIMVNNVGGPLVTMSGVSEIPIPSVMISRDAGQDLRQWIQQHPDAQIRINAQQQSSFTSVTSFSSRGSNGQTDTLTPHIAAPGADTSVIAPTATAGTDDWDYFSGTSAASPHVAGAAALVKALHPSWTPSEIQSALQTTANNTDIVTGASLQSATAFEVGSGQLDVAAAANAGIVLNETAAEFTQANRALGGEGSSLNLASFVDSNVVVSTTWSRTLRSTQNSTVTWTPLFTADDGLTLTLDVSQVVVAAAAEATFELTAQIDSEAASDWLFGELTLIPDQDLPEAHFPVAVKSTPVAGVIIQPSGSGTDASENGSIDDYEIRLNTNPNGLVQVRVEASDDLEVSSDGTTFSSFVNLAINDVFARTISVRAIDDNLAESTQFATITHRIFDTSNSEYPTGFAIDDLSVRVTDNDIGSLTLALDELSLAEDSGTVTATVTRSANSELNQPLSVAVADADGLTFLDQNGNSIQRLEIAANQTSATFTIIAVNNSVIDGNRNRTVTVSAPAYESAGQTVEVIDDDFASLKTIETSSITIVSRIGTTDSFTAEIRTQPETDVVFDVVSSDPDLVSVNTSRLIFTPENWNTPQTIVVTGIDDGQTGVADVSVQIRVVVGLSDTSYANVQAAEVNVSVTDADTSVPNIVSPIGRILSNEPWFRWSHVEEAQAYDLFVEEVGTTGNPIIDMAVPGAFSADKQRIGAYQYWVRANFADGGTSRWVMQTYQVATAPKIDSLPSNSAEARPTMTWAEVFGAEYYQVFISNRTTGETVLYDQNVETNEFIPQADFTFGVHRIWVRAVNAAGFHADWSAPVDYLLGPQLLGPLDSTFDRRPVFEWTSVAGAEEYELYIRQPDGSSIQQTVSDPTFQSEDELTTGRHTWWVRGLTASGAKGPWTAAGVTYIGGRTALLSPASSTANAAPLFTWDQVLGASEYEIFLNRTDVSEHILYRRVAGTSWQSTVLDSGDYTVWVRPISDFQEAGIWSAAHRFTISQATGQLTTNATTPQLVSFSNTPTLTWTPVAAAFSYEVFVHDGATGQHFRQLSQASLSLSDVGEGKLKWWVRVIDDARRPGPWSNSATIDTTGRTIAFGPNTQSLPVTLRWAEVIDADRYILQLDNLSTGETQVVREDHLTSNSFTLESTLRTGRYRFWVRAIRNTNPSEGFWSVPVDFLIG